MTNASVSALGTEAAGTSTPAAIVGQLLIETADPINDNAVLHVGQAVAESSEVVGSPPYRDSQLVLEYAFHDTGPRTSQVVLEFGASTPASQDTARVSQTAVEYAYKTTSKAHTSAQSTSLGGRVVPTAYEVQLVEESAGVSDRALVMPQIVLEFAWPTYPTINRISQLVIEHAYHYRISGTFTRRCIFPGTYTTACLSPSTMPQSNPSPSAMSTREPGGAMTQRTPAAAAMAQHFPPSRGLDPYA